MFDPMTYAVSPSAISSPGSACGPTRFVAPAGQMTDLFGLVPALANLSARQAKELRLMTSGTSGQPSITLSKSAVLQASLESKLRVRLLMTGSTLYTLTWKPWVTPSGVSRSRLRASVRRISEIETSGWPIPVVRDYRNSAGDGSNPRDLPRVAPLAPWATPAARDWHSASASASAEFLAERLEQSRGKPLSEQAFTLAGWPTPMVGSSGTENYNGSMSTDSLRQTEALCGKEVAGHNLVLSGWPTTSCNNDRTGNPESAMSMQRQDGSKVQQRLQDFAAITGQARLTVSGVILTGSDAEMESGGQLNLDHSLWLMGLPPAWASCCPGRSDWLAWQDLMRRASSEPSPTASSDYAALEMPSMPKLQSPGSKL